MNEVADVMLGARPVEGVGDVVISSRGSWVGVGKFTWKAGGEGDEDGQVS